MAVFTPKSLAILGRQPQLGLAELERLYGNANVRKLGDAALLSLPVEDISFKRLGGTIKLAQILGTIESTKWSDIENYLVDAVPRYLPDMDGKFTLGISAYRLHPSATDIKRTALKIKKAAKQVNRSMRIVPNKEPALNSAQVLHNKLTTKGAWELLLVRNGSVTLIAQTFFVQDIEAYAARDQARPNRDAKVGMLPPKLAQIMINLACPPEGSTILDPFCGTGVILQEALLMGYDVIGTDIEPRMISYTKDNIEWLSKYNQKALASQHELIVGDATKMKWPIHQSKNVSIVSEIYLGQPLSIEPSMTILDPILRNVEKILSGFLSNIGTQIKSGTTLSLAVPAWRTKAGFQHLPILDQLSDLGYNHLELKHVSKNDLIYWRPGQIVARQLIILTRQ